MNRWPDDFFSISLEFWSRLRLRLAIEGERWRQLYPHWLDFNWWLWKSEYDMGAWHYFAIYLRLAMFVAKVKIPIRHLDNLFLEDTHTAWERWLLRNDKCAARWRIYL